MNLKRFIYVWLVLVLACAVDAQLTPWRPWTFLPENQIDEIIGEISGELAINHMIEMGGYNRNRPVSEYSETFWEAEYVLNKLIEYGLPGAKIDRFPGGETWDVTKGELWEISPMRQKLADYDEVPAMLARNSESADVTAELVWVDHGRPEDYKGLDVKGKIVVSFASARRLMTMADSLGAVGAISLYSPRRSFDPTQILWSSINPGENARFLFFIPPREGYPLMDRLVAGEKIEVHAKIETQMLPYEIQDPTCFIPGTDPNGDEIILTAHLFEGYAKQGANDNISGSSEILEVARALNTLIEEGRLPRPKRTIRFLWIPEFSGSRPWVEANAKLMEKTLCNINSDMVGAQLSKNFSFYSVMRTSFGNPHYINDIMEHYLRYVGRTNREILQNRRYAKFLKPILAPTGSEEPFYFSIETHYGSSDHEVFNALGVRVPGVLMITWPDQFYHTSQDRPDKSDPTQLKRAAFITLAGAYTIASADDEMAMRIAGEVTSNGTRRMGHLLARGMDEISLASPSEFNDIYRQARGYIEASAMNEKATIETTLELAGDMKMVKQYVTSMGKTIDGARDGLLMAVDTHAGMLAKKHGMSSPMAELTSLEKKATRIVPRPKEALSSFSARRPSDKLRMLLEKYPINRSHAGEIAMLVNGKNSALDIKKMIDVQYDTPADVQEVINQLEIFRELDMVEM